MTFSRRTDWGNAIHLWFMNRVHNWYDRLIGHVADEHFRVAIRRAPDAELWSFALEWNRSTRVIGFFGRKEAAFEIAKEVPELKMSVAPLTVQPFGCVKRFRSSKLTTSFSNRRPASWPGVSAPRSSKFEQAAC